MSQLNPQPKLNTTQPLPDTVFKELMEEQARLLGVQSVATELQIRQSTRSDLVFRLPPDMQLLGTLFAFFRLITVIEFKSENDTFNDREFYKNLMRLYAIYVQDSKLKLQDILNVFVIASAPTRFFKVMKRLGHTFKPVEGKSWQREGKFGNQTVVFIICDELPIEEPYYPWLLFAPAKGQSWHDFVLQLLLTGANERILKAASEMRPKEFAMTVEDFHRLLESGTIDPRDIEQLDRDRDEAIVRLIQLSRRRPGSLDVVLQVFSPEERLSGLKPEERLSGLKPEELDQAMATIPTEQQELLLDALLKRLKRPE